MMIQKKRKEKELQTNLSTWALEVQLVVLVGLGLAAGVVEAVLVQAAVVGCPLVWLPSVQSMVG